MVTVLIYQFANRWTTSRTLEIMHAYVYDYSTNVLQFPILFQTILIECKIGWRQVHAITLSEQAFQSSGSIPSYTTLIRNIYSFLILFQNG